MNPQIHSYTMSAPTVFKIAATDFIERFAKEGESMLRILSKPNEASSGKVSFNAFQVKVGSEWGQLALEDLNVKLSGIVAAPKSDHEEYRAALMAISPKYATKQIQNLENGISLVVQKYPGIGISKPTEESKKSPLMAAYEILDNYFKKVMSSRVSLAAKFIELAKTAPDLKALFDQFSAENGFSGDVKYLVAANDEIYGANVDNLGDYIYGVANKKITSKIQTTIKDPTTKKLNKIDNPMLRIKPRLPKAGVAQTGKVSKLVDADRGEAYVKDGKKSYKFPDYTVQIKGVATQLTEENCWRAFLPVTNFVNVVIGGMDVCYSTMGISLGCDIIQAYIQKVKRTAKELDAEQDLPSDFLDKLTCTKAEDSIAGPAEITPITYDDNDLHDYS